MTSIFDVLIGQKVKVWITLYGQTNGIVGKLLSYNKPFIKIETRNATRIFNENTVKEILPLEKPKQTMQLQI